MANNKHNQRMQKQLSKYKAYRAVILVKFIMNYWINDDGPELRIVKEICKERGVAWNRLRRVLHYYNCKWDEEKRMVMPSTKEVIMVYLGCPLPKTFR